MTSACARCLALVAALVLVGLGLYFTASTWNSSPRISRSGNRSVMVQLTVTQPVALAALAPPSEIED
jgi:predicted transporter